MTAVLISRMNNDVIHLLMGSLAIHVSFVNYLFKSFVNLKQVDYLLNDLYDLFIYSECKILVDCIYCEYFLPTCDFLFIYITINL